MTKQIKNSGNGFRFSVKLDGFGTFLSARTFASKADAHTAMLAFTPAFDAEGCLVTDELYLVRLAK